MLLRPDPQRPSTWKKYKTGMCDGCSAGCCTLPLEVSAYDLIRLGYSDEAEMGASMKKAAKRLMKARIVRSFNPSTGIFIIEQHTHPDGVLICIFNSKDKTCTVYEKRPEVCRQFPKIGPKPGWCPGDALNRKSGKIK
jgi:uncharacterized protein